MSTRIWMVVDLDHAEGPKISQDQLRQLYEDDAIDSEVWFGESLYRVKVLGLAANQKELDESIKRRRDFWREVER